MPEEAGRFDEEGRRLDGRPLSYSDYINVPALLKALRVPKEVPKGTKGDEWPVWPDGWEPGDPWPRGGNWCHDEALFIATHQAFEVWFRHALHELDDVMVRARERAAEHGSKIARADVVRRMPDAAPLLRDRLDRYPRVAGLVEKSRRRSFLMQTVAPGVFGIGDADLEGARPRLAWFAEDWAVIRERIGRAAHILEICIPFFDVLRRMTPASFLEFRGRLVPASGFGSGQFRELEILMGLREAHFGKISPDDPDASGFWDSLSGPERELATQWQTPPEAFRKHSPGDAGRLVTRMTSPSLRDLVYWLLQSEELAGADLSLRWEKADRWAEANYRQLEQSDRWTEEHGLTQGRDVWDGMGRILAHSESVIATDINADPQRYPGFQPVLESCLRLDAALMQWRAAHVRFVEGMIGSRPGTGGGGVRYLRTTVDRGRAEYLIRAFPALWAQRTLLV